MINVIREQRKDGWEFTAHVDGVIVATLTAVCHDNNVLVHNQVNLWSPSLRKEYRRIFDDFRQELRENGFTLVTASCDRCTEKIRKYWRHMGFEFFGEFTLDGKQIHYAVMEA